MVQAIPVEQGAFFAEVQIHRIRKALHFPMLYVTDPLTKSHNYTNDDLLICATTHWMDSQFLADLVENHELYPEDYTILRGYYFNEGRNNSVKDYMEFLKLRRDEAKLNKNPIEMLYKLLANSLYGRMLMKPIKTQRVFRPAAKLRKYLQTHYHSILWVTEITASMYCIEQYKPIIAHWSMPHIGAEILSKSKHIMNVPMVIAERNNIANYYMDTDSMHIALSDLPRLAELFEQSMGYSLIGDGFGQFKCDFTLPGASQVKAVGTWILGKKCYLDLLEGTDKDGNKVEGFHPRMKGCSQAALYAKGAELFPELSRRMQVAGVYDLLMNNHSIEFDLLARGEGAQLGFVSNKNFTTSTRQQFNRTYSFNGPINTVI